MLVVLCKKVFSKFALETIAVKPKYPINEAYLRQITQKPLNQTLI